MKSLAPIICIATLIALGACDKVTKPIIKTGATGGNNFITQSSDPDLVDKTAIRKVLLEDYTGLRCPNCPAGTGIIDKILESKDGERVVVISVHQGGLAAPLKSFPKDFRTEIGDAWGGTSGYGISSYPTGLINRKKYSASSELFDRSVWQEKVSLALKDPFVVKLILTTKYDSTARALYVNVDATFKKSHPNPVNMVAVYTEDGIFGPQDSVGIKLDNYEFKHMLRGGLNGSDGTSLTKSIAPKVDVVYKDSCNTTLPLTINDSDKGYGTAVNHNKVSVIAFIYDVVTKEILQAEKVKITGE